LRAEKTSIFGKTSRCGHPNPLYADQQHITRGKRKEKGKSLVIVKAGTVKNNKGKEKRQRQEKWDTKQWGRSQKYINKKGKENTGCQWEYKKKK